MVLTHRKSIRVAILRLIMELWLFYTQGTERPTLPSCCLAHVTNPANFLVGRRRIWTRTPNRSSLSQLQETLKRLIPWCSCSFNKDFNYIKSNSKNIAKHCNIDLCIYVGCFASRLVKIVMGTSLDKQLKEDCFRFRREKEFSDVP